MATPELVPERLERAHPLAAENSPEQRKKFGNVGNVIEFDPNGTASAARDSVVPPAEAGHPPRPQGFTYDGVRAGRAIRAGLSRRPAACRPLPMEDVCFYIKPLDNSQLRRQFEPDDKRKWLRLVGLGVVAVVLVLASHAPRALLRESGYRLEKLHQQQQALMEINEQLKVRQAMMSDLRRVAELAAKRGLTDTPTERFAWQDRTIPPPDNGELAQNRRETQP